MPDASYWMYKFATPEEAFLKAREAVDLRLQQGTIVPRSETESPPQTPSDEVSLPAKSAIASPAVPPPVYEPMAVGARSGGWNKRAGWGLALGIFGALSTWREHEQSFLGTFFHFIALIPIQWAMVYGTWSFALWLYRCITLNRSKKPLWNLRAGWAIVLAFVVYIPFTIYYYWDSPPVVIENAIAAGTGWAVGSLPGVICGLISPYDLYFNGSDAITAGIGFFPYAIFFFYGMLTGLTYLWQIP